MNSCGKVLKQMLKIKASLTILQLFIFQVFYKPGVNSKFLRIFCIFLNGIGQILLQFT